MKQEQVIELAYECGIFTKQDGDVIARSNTEYLERLAKLVEQATLERAAKVCDEFYKTQLESVKKTGGGSCYLRASGANACSTRIRNLAKESQ